MNIKAFLSFCKQQVLDFLKTQDRVKILQLKTVRIAIKVAIKKHLPTLPDGKKRMEAKQILALKCCFHFKLYIFSWAFSQSAFYRGICVSKWMIFPFP